jgi:hypothetical protein
LGVERSDQMLLPLIQVRKQRVEFMLKLFCCAHASSIAQRALYVIIIVLQALIGVSILVAVAAHRALRGRSAPAIALALVFLGWYDFRHHGVIRASMGRRPVASASTVPASRILDVVIKDDVPIAVPNAHLYLESTYGLPTKDASRLVFVSAEDDTPTLGMRALSRLRPINVNTYASFVAANKRFVIYAPNDDGIGNWLITRLVQDGATVTIKAQNWKLRLFEVETRDRRGVPGTPYASPKKDSARMARHRAAAWREPQDGKE